MQLYKIIGTTALFAAIGLSSCNKSYLDTKPSHQVALEDVFTTTVGAKAVINGIHRILYTTPAGSEGHDQFGVPAINMYYDLMGEDFGFARDNWFYDAANYNKARSGASLTWNLYYNVINNANFVLNYIDDATGTEADKNEIKGQAYALRGWAYLQLIQTYQFAFGSPQYVVGVTSETGGTIGAVQEGATSSQALGVPIYTAPTKEGKPRAPMSDVLNRISTDLDSSVYYFEQGVASRGTDKSQININVAYGLVARYALYQRSWDKAITAAQKAREGYQLSTGTALLDGFNRTSSGEWIWGSLINQEQNGIYASFASHMDPALKAYGATGQKIAGRFFFFQDVAYNFRALDLVNDVRAKWWIPFSGTIPPEYNGVPGYVRRTQLKFKAQSSSSFVADYPLMRVAEMYLIEAEAKAMANDLSGATSVLEEFVVTRNPEFAAETGWNVGTKGDLVQEIWRQRRIELWGEGFRLFDAKRQMVNTPGVTPLLAISRTPSSFYGPIYNQTISIQAGSPQLNFRIPVSEINQNNTVIQNP